MNLDDLKKPADALGFDKKGVKRIEGLIRSGVEKGWYPAAVYMLLRHGMIAAQGAFGRPQPDARPGDATTLDTVFDMASLTKPVTATLLLQLVEEGALHLGMDVEAFLPEAAKTPVADLTLRDLATHTSGLPAWKPLYKNAARPALAQILATETEAKPGERYKYSDLGYILLGEIVSRVGGKPLDALARERVFAPQGMDRSGYRPDAKLHTNTAATAHCPMREGKTLIGEVHDANAHSMGGVSGHAGLFSTTPDMARFALALMYPSVAAHGKRAPLFGPLARRLAMHSQIDPKIGGHSIGWFTVPNGMLPKGDLLSDQCFGHTGFTGTLLLFDPAHDLTLIFLTNRVYSESDGAGVLRLRRLLANAIAGSLTA